MNTRCPSRKYPRSPHLPWSPGGTSDDRRLATVAGLLGEPIIISEKLDGSNIVLLSDCLYARSHTGPPPHASFDWAKAAHAALKQLIPADYSVFCEYTYAVHTIVYRALPSYFWIIGVRDDESSFWLSWDDVEMFSRDLQLPTVPVLWEGIVGDVGSLVDLTTSLGTAPGLFGEREGIVARVARGFDESEFGKVVGKWVRMGHVPDDAIDWWKRPVQRRTLEGDTMFCRRGLTAVDAIEIIAPMTTSRSLRRYHKERMKKRAQEVYPLDKRSYRWADNLKCCSCPMCGNPRHHSKGDEKVTVQERQQQEMEA